MHISTTLEFKSTNQIAPYFLCRLSALFWIKLCSVSFKSSCSLVARSTWPLCIRSLMLSSKVSFLSRRSWMHEYISLSSDSCKKKNLFYAFHAAIEFTYYPFLIHLCTEACWGQLEEKILSLLLIAIIIAFKCKRLHLIIVIIVLKCKILHLNGKHCIKSQCTLNFKAKDCILSQFSMHYHATTFWINCKDYCI